MQKLNERRGADADTPAPSDEAVLLTDIRDLLRAQGGGRLSAAARQAAARRYARSGAHGPLAVLRRHRRVRAHRPARPARRCWSAAAATGCSSTAARARSASSCGRVGLPEIDAVFLTHFHLDHWLGLPGMLKSFELRDREKPLTLFGPPGTTELLGTMRRVIGRLRYPFSRPRARRRRRRRVRRLRDRRPSTCATAARPSATRWSRRRGPGASTPSWPPRSASPSGRTSGACSAARPSTGCRPSRSSAPSARAARSSSRATRRPARWSASPPTRPTCSSTRRRSCTRTSRARRRPGTAPRARPPSSRAEAAGPAAGAHAPLHALRRAATSARRRARCSPAREVPRDFDAVEVPLPEKGEPELLRFDPEGAEAAR